MFRKTEDKQPTDREQMSKQPPSSPNSQGSMYNQTPAYTPTATPALSESESMARDIKDGSLSGFVGNGTRLSGQANFKGMLRVDGHLSGTVASEDGTLIVSNNGTVEASVSVAVAQVYGTITGDVIASKRIELGRTGKIVGDIHTPSLQIEAGAVLEGRCSMVKAASSESTGSGNGVMGR
jgi:cytoskeletal protein CcmA (bactofilin family)